MFSSADRVSLSFRLEKTGRYGERNSTRPDNAVDKGGEWKRIINNGVQITGIYDEIYDTSHLNKTGSIWEQGLELTYIVK